MVLPGEIVVSEIDTVIDGDDVKVWEADLVSKYAEIFAYTDTDVMLCASDRTLCIDESAKGHPTTLCTGLAEGWTVVADCARYTCRVVAYRRPTP